MDPITSRNRNRSVSADAYWRRRLFALAAGLAVLGLLAWAVGGASAPRQTAATTSLHHQDHHGNPPGTGALPVVSASASPRPSPSPSRTGGPRGHTHGGQQAGQDTKPRAGHTAAGTTAHGGDCAAADVVITLTASGNSYGPAARPRFGVDVVSTAPRTCTFNVGSRYLRLLIESGGVRVWNSADCAGRSGASSVTKLQRGVPVPLRFSWDRRLSAPGCRLPQPAARPGTYTVRASDGRLHSHMLVFVLR
jgi:hypothetical protein